LWSAQRRNLLYAVAARYDVSMICHPAVRGAALLIAGALLAGVCPGRAAAIALPPGFPDYCHPPPQALSGAALTRLVLRAPVRLATAAANPVLRPDCLGPTRILITGTAAHGLVDSMLIVRGRLRKGTRVTLVPIVSGGSGGIFEALLFTGGPGVEHYAATLRGVEPGHLRVSIEHGYVVERSPQDSTANCCWKHDYVRRSTVAGGRVRVLDVRIRPNPHPS
jgi:hypothetical protein